MRKDMHKVVTTRGRRNGGRRSGLVQAMRRDSRSLLSRLVQDEVDPYPDLLDDPVPSKLGMKGRYERSQHLDKEFTDVLGPLRRYLRGQVGRPWDKVYADVCEGCRASSELHQWHLLNHLRWEVADPVTKERGIFYDAVGHQVGPGRGFVVVDGVLRLNTNR